MRRFIQRMLMLLLLVPCQLNAGDAGIQITEAWIREAPPGLNLNAAYMRVKNNTGKNIILNSVSSPDYNRIEIHKSILADGMARMQLQTQLEIKANTFLHLTPGAYHLMLFEASRAMRAGDSAFLKLGFSGSEQITIEVEVKKLNPEISQSH